MLAQNNTQIIMQTNTINPVITDLQALANPNKAEHLQRFFKTGEGQYAHGDIFWGITVPAIRAIAHKHKETPAKQLELLLTHNVHEVRLCTLLIMIFQTKTNPDQMFDVYLKKTAFINNWDLVDLSAPVIVGNFLSGKDCAMLYTLATSPALWEKRIAIIATLAFIKQGHHEHTLRLAEILLHDNHDLIRKAVGWMLREVGKRCSRKVLEDFLETYAATMPRTTLRYAIEHFSPEQKKYFMQKKQRSLAAQH